MRETSNREGFRVVPEVVDASSQQHALTIFAIQINLVNMPGLTSQM